VIETILFLENEGIRLAPRTYGFDYFLSEPLTIEQSKAIIRLKEVDKEVCQYLVDRAKRNVKACKGILEGS
jgi:hypothetical protein